MAIGLKGRGGPAKPPAQEPPARGRPLQPGTPPMETQNTLGVGSMMIASMPSLASGADVYSRQFYRGSSVPFRRYLPINVQ